MRSVLPVANHQKTNVGDRRPGHVEGTKPQEEP